MTHWRASASAVNRSGADLSPKGRTMSTNTSLSRACQADAYPWGGLVGPPGSPECGSNVAIMKEVCGETGLPTEPEKDEGGMEMDTEELEIRLPQDKLSRLRTALVAWQGRKACKKRELLLLMRLLSHACKAVWAGRSFLRRLIDCATSVKQMDRWVRLSRSARSDIEWWQRYCAQWNGTAMMSVVNRVEPDFKVSMVSDASGCGALHGQDWFQLKWEGLGENSQQNITVKELLPVLIAAAMWGKRWAGSTQCDNTAVVEIVNSGSCRLCTSAAACWPFWRPNSSFTFGLHTSGDVTTC